MSSSPLSSPLSSVGSRSPSHPVDYPSPPSSTANDSEKGGNKHARGPAAALHQTPPPKRQRIAKPKELKTEHLNLRVLNDSNDEDHHKAEDLKLKKLMEALRTKRKIVVIAGAGISVSAGIPDFRSSKGQFSILRTQHKLKSSGKHLFDASVYRNDSSTSSFHDMVRELSHQTQNAQATPFHHMLATLAEEGRLLRLYTQNVDGIDTSLKPLKTTVPLNAKGPWPKTIQLHGGLERMVCSKCGHLSKFDGALFEGPEPPPCPECEEMDAARQAGGLRSHGVGRLRPRMVLYNEFNPDEEAIGAVSHADLKSRPDAVIVVGTSLKVPGIRRLTKELCSVTRGRRGGFTAWINHDPEPVGVEFKDCWDMVVRGECDDVARSVNLPRWDDKDYGDYLFMEDSRKKEASGSRAEVVLDLKPIPAVSLLETDGILTPTASPRQQSPSVSDGPPRLKQAPLSFPGTHAAITVNDSKVKKRPGRKPGVRKPLPSAPTKGNKITNAFTATKTNKVGRPKKIIDESERPALARETPMHPVSVSNTGTDSNPIALKSPETPKSQVQIEIPSYRRETISPRSIPAGMANLLD